MMNPRDKKELDLSRNCKNRYGKSDKAARKGVRRKKRITTHRARREGFHAINQIISACDPDEVESSVSSLPPHGSNAKWPDTPLNMVLQDKIKRKIQMILSRPGEVLEVIEEFNGWCQTSTKLATIHIGAWVRYLRAVGSIGIIPIPKISAEDQRALHATLISFSQKHSDENYKISSSNGG
jgi:hypothetical protein